MKQFKTKCTNMIASLEGVEVGDEFYVYKLYTKDKTIVKCERVTAKQAVIGGNKYRISDAFGFGSDRWYKVPSLRLLTPEIRAEIKDREKSFKLLRDIKKFDFDKLELKRLRELHAFLHGDKNETE